MSKIKSKQISDFNTSVTTRINSTSINALSDVDTVTSAPTNGQSLIWNSSSSTWTPSTISTGNTFASGNRSITTNTNASGTSSEEYYIATAALTVTLPVPSSSNVNNKIIVKSYTSSAVTIASASSSQIMYDSTSLSANVTHPASMPGFSTTFICQQIGSSSYAWVVV